MVAAFAGKNLLESSVLFRVFGFLGRIAISARWLRCFEYNDLVQWVQLWFQTQKFSVHFRHADFSDFIEGRWEISTVQNLPMNFWNFWNFWFRNSECPILISEFMCARLKSFETYRSPLSQIRRRNQVPLLAPSNRSERLPSALLYIIWWRLKMEMNFTTNSGTIISV